MARHDLEFQILAVDCTLRKHRIRACSGGMIQPGSLRTTSELFRVGPQCSESMCTGKRDCCRQSCGHIFHNGIHCFAHAVSSAWIHRQRNNRDSGKRCQAYVLLCSDRLAQPRTRAVGRQMDEVTSVTDTAAQ